ncbi:hypothetical protein [Levilactobacillus spicheri]|uniref:hypothetical protein n=1 Tax=Levilactobacillus spicheri TaxID=216463 RepID=UPI00138F5437|nr:hypothetical protein [Levilactobacillus spicheri]
MWQAIRQIQEDYRQGRIENNLHRKTTDYLRRQGWTYALALRRAVQRLPYSRYYRGPSVHHWMATYAVYEFISAINDQDFYLKFDLKWHGTLVESIHQREYAISSRWHPVPTALRKEQENGGRNETDF